MKFVLICCSDIVGSAIGCGVRTFAVLVLGLSPGEISDSFWKLKPGEEGADDVILRILEPCLVYIL